MDQHCLTEWVLACQKVFSVPDDLWEWVLGKQDSIAELIFKLCRSTLFWPMPWYQTYMLGNWFFLVYILLIKQNGFLLFSVANTTTISTKWDSCYSSQSKFKLGQFTKQVNVEKSATTLCHLQSETPCLIFCPCLILAVCQSLL